jgi:hypothetical protein
VFSDPGRGLSDDRKGDNWRLKHVLTSFDQDDGTTWLGYLVVPPLAVEKEPTGGTEYTRGRIRPGAHSLGRSAPSKETVESLYLGGKEYASCMAEWTATRYMNGILS